MKKLYIVTYYISMPNKCTSDIYLYNFNHSLYSVMLKNIG